MSERIMVGPSDVRYEEDTGFIYVTHVGELDGPLAKELLAACRKFVTDPDGPVFMLADDRRATGMTSDARKTFSDSPPVGGTLYLAVFGGSFAFRVVCNLVFKAMTFSSTQLVGVMVSDEAEARAWLNKKRSALAA